MRIRRKDIPHEDFQMTPMIDMVFLLLVFFMCVSTLASADRGIEVALPLARESRVPQELADRSTITVLADGRIFLGARAVPASGLGEHLAAERSRTPGLRLVVRAAKDTPFAKIKPVLHACASAGIADIIYSTLQDG